MARSILALALALLAGAAHASIANDQHFAGGLKPDGVPTGKITKLAALDAYVAAPAGGKPTGAVILFPDIYGWQANGTRLWADRLAKAGFVAVLPDFFRGDVVNGTDFMALIGRQKPERVLADYTAVVAAVKKAYPTVKKIGQQGFCWGGLYTGLLSTSKAPKADAAVAFHASLLTPADIDKITGPVSFQQSDPKLDKQINSTFYAYITKSFAAKKAKGGAQEITYYPGAPHGYSIRVNQSDPVQVKASDTAFEAGVAFLKKHLAA